MNLEGLHIASSRDELPDAGEGMCCVGAASMGQDRCTCWEPAYNLEQQPIQEGPSAIAAQCCGDCAFRPDSPESLGTEDYAEPPPLDGAHVFFCHTGMRRQLLLRHPQGTEVVSHPAAYAPPTRVGMAWKADGTPAGICAGYAARRGW